MKAGEGMPAGRQTLPREKPEGGLMKDTDEITPVPHNSKPRQPGAPGATDPDSPRNRDLSFLSLPAMPGHARAVRG